VKADNGTRVSLSPLRPEFPNAVGDTCRPAEQQEGGWLGDRPHVAFARAAISGSAVTALIGRTVDGGRHRQERKGAESKSRSLDHSGRVSCARQTHQLFHFILDSVRIAPARDLVLTTARVDESGDAVTAVTPPVQQRRNQRRLSSVTYCDLKI
jgi:hypothetical protein